MLQVIGALDKQDGILEFPQHSARAPRLEAPGRWVPQCVEGLCLSTPLRECVWVSAENEGRGANNLQ